MRRGAAKGFGRIRVRLPGHVTALLLILVSAAACGDVTDPPPATPLEIVVESGDEQAAEVGDTLPEPVVATVFLPDGRMSQRSIWVHLVDGGHVDLGGARASGEGAVLRSRTSGTVSVEWTLAEEAGTQRLQFFTLELYGGTVEAFATAEALTEAPGS